MIQRRKEEGWENNSRPSNHNTGRRLYAVAPDGTVVGFRDPRELAKAARAYAREYRRA